MPSPRITESELQTILRRKGYGIGGGVGGGLTTSIVSRSHDPKDRSPRPIDDVEPDSGDEQVGSEILQIRCAGKVVVRIKFYRRRLADYSRAVSEKALIDALAYAGALSGDTEKEIRLIDEGQEKVDSKDQERTEITLEYPEVDFSNLWEEKTRKDGR